jgi:hypothetical protein
MGKCAQSANVRKGTGTATSIQVSASICAPAKIYPNLYRMLVASTTFYRMMIECGHSLLV